LVDHCSDDAEFGALTIMNAECSLRRFIDDRESITVAVVDEREILRQIDRAAGGATGDEFDVAQTTPV